MPSIAKLCICTTSKPCRDCRLLRAYRNRPGGRAPKRKSSPTSSQRTCICCTRIRSMNCFGRDAARKSLVEPAHMRSLQPQRGQQLELLAQRSQARRRLVRRKELTRVRLEGHHAGSQMPVLRRRASPSTAWRDGPDARRRSCRASARSALQRAREDDAGSAYPAQPEQPLGSVSKLFDRAGRDAAL